MGSIHKLEGKMDRYVYRNILEGALLPFCEWEMSLKFIFQHHNDPKDSTKLLKEWFLQQKINVLK